MAIARLTQDKSRGTTPSALPHRAPFDRAAPELSQFQMKSDHVNIQGRVHPLVTDDAKAWGGMTKRPVRSLPGVLKEALHVRCPTTQFLEYSLRPASAKRGDINQRNVRRPPSRRSSQIGNDNVMEPVSP